MGLSWTHFTIVPNARNMYFIAGLLHLLERCGGGLDTVPLFSWSDELSPGELQRLCFARLFFHRPVVAILVNLCSHM